MRNLIVAALAAVTMLTGSVAEGASVRGRADLGGTVFVIRQLENGAKKRDIWMSGPRFDATIIPHDDYGFCLKPFAMYGRGGNSDLFQAGLGIGHYTPINDCISVIPFIGASYFNLNTKINTIMFIPGQEGSTPGLVNGASQENTSRSFYIGGDVIYNINKCFSLTGTFQYAWANVTTVVKNGIPTPIPFTQKGASQGVTVALGADYSFCGFWVANATVAYNSSLDKEKYGIKAYGLKLAVGRTF